MILADTFVFDESIADEQTMAELTPAAHSTVKTILIDKTNIIQGDVVYRIYTKIDGTNYKEILQHQYFSSDDSTDSMELISINGRGVPISTDKAVKVTMQCAGGGVGGVNVPYRIGYVLEDDYDDSIYCADAGTSSMDWPYGLVAFPTDTIDHALTIAAAVGLNTIRISRTDNFVEQTIGNCDSKHFIGELGQNYHPVNLNHATHDKCRFTDLYLTGDEQGTDNIFENCHFYNGSGYGVFTGANNMFVNCTFEGRLYVGQGKFIGCKFLDAFSLYGDAGVEGTINLIGCLGCIYFRNFTVTYNVEIRIHGFNGTLFFDNSNTTNGASCQIYGGKYYLLNQSTYTIVKYASDPSKGFLMGTNNSDGDIEMNDSTGDFNSTQQARINSEVDTALNTAIPGSPVADSINQRIKAIDDKLPALTYLAGSTNPDADMNNILLAVNGMASQTWMKKNLQRLMDVIDHIKRGTIK